MMLIVLLASALVLRWGERAVSRAVHGTGRLALAITILLGLAFLALQCFDYRSHLKTLTPSSNSYGSIFYAISGFHVAHIVIGVLLLAYTLFLPAYGAKKGAPYRPYRTVALYWYFVNVLWICVFVILYLIPNLLIHG
jgi:heme/copper-type cytochrome/quinol oxidase subunit 3